MNDNPVYTGSENIERESREQQGTLRDTSAILGGSALVLGAASHYVNSNEKARSFIAGLPGANRYSEKYKEARAHSTARGFVPIDLDKIYEHQTFGKSLLSMASTVEELSPMGVLKTLQITNLLEPFIEPTVHPGEVRIKGSSIQAFESIYREQLAKNGKKLDATNLKYGFILKNGMLYAVQPDGSVDYADPFLRNAKMITSHVKMGERISPNRVLQKYANVIGTKLPHNAFDAEQTVVIGDNSKARLASNWLKSYIRQGMEIGYKTMDNPLGGLEDILKATGVDNMPFAETEMFKNIKSKLNLNLGTNGRYDLSTRESLSVMSKNIVTKSAALYLGYQGVNQVLNKVTDEDSIWNDGILAGVTSIYSKGRVDIAKVTADPFQAYKQEQEYAAEGSTSLTTLAGFPIAGATLGASISYYKRLSDSAKLGVEAATSLSETPNGHGIADKLFKRMGIKELTPFKSNAIKGALVGAIFASPFLPGALIGESSEELQAKYSGIKEVENRANRWWLAGGNKFDGDQIKNHQASWVARTLANTKDEALYDGDMKRKLDYDPLYSPLKYLRNPYKYEQDTQESRPYPVWGMEVNYGSFLGKLFQGTIGEIIKPTILSPQLKKEMEVENPFRPQNVTEEVPAGSTVVANGQGTEQGSASGTGTSGVDTQGAPTAIKKTDGTFSVKTEPRRKDKQLIESGMMLRDDDAAVDPIGQPIKKAYAALGDFVGLKGFIGNSLLNNMGLSLEESNRQFARSGHASSAATIIKEANLGDIGGIGEFQRRIVPTSASSKQDVINPLRNKVAPSWLPRDESKYYLDFGKGDYWDKIDNAEARLPGQGYASLHADVKGLNPEDYPLAHRYKILSDVAMGSAEQIALKKQMLAKVSAGEIQGKDKDLFYTTLEQEQARTEKRSFNEYLTDKEKSNLSFSGKLLNSLWEFGAHKAENALEPMTPFRPASKFIHARSAIEDYNKTMLQGPDTGIWTSPYEHFIRVAWNRSKDTLLPGTQKPIEAGERDNVEEYFDKLEYMKARKNNDMNAVLKTTVGRSFAGIQDSTDMNRFKRSLSKDQRLYVDSFSRETDPSKRKEILDMLPKDVGMAYMDIWNNLQTAEKAKSEGRDMRTAVKEEYSKNTKKIAEVYNIKAGSGKVTPTVNKDGKEVKPIDPELETRLKAADLESERFVSHKTGVPSKDWLGWDPRLTMADVKLRTLTVGKADIFRYGFWNQDKDRNERIVALDQEREITDKYKQIKKQLQDTNVEQEKIKRHLFEKGIVSDKVVLSDASQNDVRIKLKQGE